MSATAGKPAESEQPDARTILFGAGSPRVTPMRVIVCGLGRTGTASMQTALQILGMRTYHSFNLWADSASNIETWNTAFDAKYNPHLHTPLPTRAEFDAILGEYSAIVDVPGAFFGPELASSDAYYPDAKVIILNREPEAWFRSCQAAFTPNRRGSLQRLMMDVLLFWNARVRVLARYMDKKQRDVWRFEWHDDDAREKALRFFHAYYAECRDNIAEEKRLEYTIQDGWAPLCEFLGVAVPSVIGEDGVRKEVPFPRTNEAAAFLQVRKKFSAPILAQAKWDWISRIGLVAAVGQSIYLARRFWLPVVFEVIRFGASMPGVMRRSVHL